MTNYLRFASGEGEAADVLVEVDAADDLPVPSEQNAGLRQWARDLELPGIGSRGGKLPAQLLAYGPQSGDHGSVVCLFPG